MLPPQYQQAPNAPMSSRTQQVPVNNAPTYVDLNKNQKIGVSNLVNHQEKIYYAGVVAKVNKHLAAQNRILVITNKFLYNIDPEGSVLSGMCLCSSTGGYTVKRKISMSKIFGVTVSINPTSELQQFVIHVQGEYDYLYNGRQKREKILKSLFNAHFANSTQPFVFYCRDEANLLKFHTTDDDLAAKVNKRPKDGQILVTPDMAANGAEWIIFNRKNFTNKPPIAHMNSNPGYYPNQPQPMVPYYPGPHNFSAPFPQNGYFPQQNVPQWGNPFYAEQAAPNPNNNIPSYYIPEAQPQSQPQPQQYNNFPPAPTTVNVPYQYPQNINTQPQNNFPSQQVNQKIQKQDDFMTMQAKKQSSNAHDGSFTRNILPYNPNPNANVQIHTNFDYAYPTGQQQNLPYNNYPNYNNTQNQNGRGPYTY